MTVNNNNSNNNSKDNAARTNNNRVALGKYDLLRGDYAVKREGELFTHEMIEMSDDDARALL